MNPGEIYGMGGRSEGFECSVCYRVVPFMWGNECNQCRRQAKIAKETIAALKEIGVDNK